MPKRLINPGRIAIGYVGLGGRGCGELHTLLAMPELDFPAVCDVYPDRAAKGADIVELSGRPRPVVYTDYREMLKRDDLDAVGVMTSWQTHIEISIAAMRAGYGSAAPMDVMLPILCVSAAALCVGLAVSRILHGAGGNAAL